MLGTGLVLACFGIGISQGIIFAEGDPSGAETSAANPGAALDSIHGAGSISETFPQHSGIILTADWPRLNQIHRARATWAGTAARILHFSGGRKRFYAPGRFLTSPAGFFCKLSAR